MPRALRGAVEVVLDEPGQPLPVQANAVLLEEAVDNVIDNALRYGCPPGSELTLRLARQDNLAILRVIDQGPGIPGDMAEKVFERFVRLSSEDDGGSGLGLPIVRAIIESAGGQVRLEQSDRGTVLMLCLPLAR